MSLVFQAGPRGDRKKSLVEAEALNLNLKFLQPPICTKKSTPRRRHTGTCSVA